MHTVFDYSNILRHCYVTHHIKMTIRKISEI